MTARFSLILGKARGHRPRLQPATLVAGQLIHNIQQRLALKKPAKVFKETFKGGSQKSFDAIGRVRRDQHVWHLPERMFHREWFFVENIERCAADPSGFKGSD